MNINHNKKKLIYTTIIALVIAVLSGIMSFFGFPKRLENMAQDGLYHRPEKIPDNIKIIAITSDYSNNIPSDERIVIIPYTNLETEVFSRA